MLMDGPEHANTAPSAGGEDFRLGGFATGYGVYSDREQNGNEVGAQSDTYAGQFGLNYKFNSHWLAGMSFTYAHGNIDFDQARGSIDENSYRIGPYVGFHHGPWFANSSLTYALRTNDLTRRVPVTGGEYTADYNVHDLSAYLGGGVDLALCDWKLTPGASVQYIHSWSDSYDENGGGGALSVDGAEFDSLRTTLGLTLSRVFTVGNIKLMPQVGAGWAHEYLNDGENLSARFIGGTSPFMIATAGGDRDNLFYGAGVSALLNDGITLSIGYQGETSSHEQVHSVAANLSWVF
jgi:outer membrane autotransporter protein